MREKRLKYWRIALAADEVGVARQTIQSALERGELTCHRTACGLPLVDLNELRRWVARAPNRRPGRKAQAG